MRNKTGTGSPGTGKSVIKQALQRLPDNQHLSSLHHLRPMITKELLRHLRNDLPMPVIVYLLQLAQQFGNPDTFGPKSIQGLFGKKCDEK